MKAVAVAALILGLSACGTGVVDEKGWNKALKRGYPCAELIDIAAGLPPSVDRGKVADDLRRAGCEPHSAPAAVPAVAQGSGEGCCRVVRGLVPAPPGSSDRTIDWDSRLSFDTGKNETGSDHAQSHN